MLRICPRESKLITALKTAVQQTSIRLVTDEVLGTGDVLVYGHDDNKIFAVIERKTHADLQSSLRDARYTSQTDRMKAMMNAGECHTAGYLIEGTKTSSCKAFTDVRDSIQLKHRLLFLETVDADASAKLLLHIANKATQYSKTLASEQELTSGVLGSQPTGTFARKGELRVRYFFQHQLMLVPGVSASVANAIVKVHPTLNSLFSAWQLCPDTSHKQNLLSDIVCNETTKRKIGPKVSARVHDLFCL